MHVTPASLLFRLRQPEQQAAWDRFVDIYTPLLVHWSQKLGYQSSDSADLVQDVFLILWRKLPEFEYDRSRSFHAWLKTVFLNRHRTKLRERHAKGLSTIEDVPSEVDDEYFEHSDDRMFVIRQAYKLIESEFSTLHQTVFRMYVLEECDPNQVAHDMGLSPATVYAIKSKVLSRLRQELRELID
jgi:RNA polymerase sigma-70 factor, ECF subfamily